MNYYKILVDGAIVGVASNYDFRRHQKKHNILVACESNDAQYIQCGERLYRDTWLLDVSTEKFDYDNASIVPIEQEEYDILHESITSGNMPLFENEEDDQQDQTQLPEYAINTLEFVIESKESEMNRLCNKAISDGFDIVLSDGKSHHFSMSVYDQLNMVTMSLTVGSGAKQVPYHADGEPYVYYSAKDARSILAAAESHKQFHTSYFNALTSYIESLDDIVRVSNIRYGDDIPTEFVSDVLRNFLN